eukprot:scaffold53078_cov72-Attheya_sp.AAC.2
MDAQMKSRQVNEDRLQSKRKALRRNAVVATIAKGGGATVGGKPFSIFPPNYAFLVARRYARRNKRMNHQDLKL